MVFNKHLTGRAWTEAEIQAVWDKARIVPGAKDTNGNLLDSNMYRLDACGRWIQKTKHGNEDSKYGWEIDHIKPKAKGGSSDLGNLQPLFWKTNRSKGDTFPWSCPAQ